MTESETAANAAAVLTKLREDEQDLIGEIRHLNTRLEVTREVIKALTGVRPRGRPKGKGKDGDAEDPKLDFPADAGTAQAPA